MIRIFQQGNLFHIHPRSAADYPPSLAFNRAIRERARRVPGKSAGKGQTRRLFADKSWESASLCCVYRLCQSDDGNDGDAKYTSTHPSLPRALCGCIIAELCTFFSVFHSFPHEIMENESGIPSPPLLSLPAHAIPDILSGPNALFTLTTFLLGFADSRFSRAHNWSIAKSREIERSTCPSPLPREDDFLSASRRDIPSSILPRQSDNVIIDFPQANFGVRVDKPSLILPLPIIAQ